MKSFLYCLSAGYVFISSLLFGPILIFLHAFSTTSEVFWFRIVVIGIISVILVGTFFTNIIRLFENQPRKPEK